MSYVASRREETAVLSRVVAEFPEASADEVAQLALDDLWIDDEADPTEVDFAFWHLRERARVEWACPGDERKEAR